MPSMYVLPVTWRTILTPRSNKLFNLLIYQFNLELIFDFFVCVIHKHFNVFFLHPRTEKYIPVKNWYGQWLLQ